MLNPIQRALMGLPGNPFGLNDQEDPQKPGAPMQLAGAAMAGGQQQPTTADVASPMLGADLSTVALDKMGQMGALLMAAGQRMTPAQRGQILAQGANVMGNTGREMLNLQQARLMGAKSQEAQKELERRADFEKQIAADPTILGKLGITEEQYKVMGAEAVADALKARMSRNPIQDAYMQAQINHLSQPKWTITGQDEFGRPKYDLVSPDGNIITPAGANRGGQAGIMEQLGDLQGPEALAKLKQINPALASEVLGIADSRMPFPSKKMGTPEGAMLNALVSQVAGPGFNAMDFPARQKAWEQQGLNTPNSSGGIRKLSETALRHFKNLIDNSDMLPENDYGIASQIANKGQILKATRSANSKDPFTQKLSKYENTLEIGGDEMAKALGIASEGGREAIKAMFDPSQGKGVVQQKIRNQIRLLGEKLRSQQDDWNRVMGPVGSKRLQIIQPDVAEILKLGEEQQPEAPQNNLPHGVRSIKRIN